MRNQAVNRRTFLAGAPPRARAPMLPGGAWGRLPPPPDVGVGQGVASGQPATNGITLWTKPDGLTRDARLQVEISPDADFRRVIYRQTTSARAANAYTVHHRAEHKVLRPG